MKHQPSTLARNVSMMQCDTDNVREDIKIQDFQSNRFQKTRRSAAMATHAIRRAFILRVQHFSLR
ncbi:hypothetical protein JCM18902_1181 [Psychrobacter sp. JCM 18902]|nr:hypothetical protein JCM18902_1181 [Psychrobacter sp. JCM 18902]